MANKIHNTRVEIQTTSAGIIYENAVKDTLQAKGFMLSSIVGVVEYFASDSSHSKQSHENISFVEKQLELANKISDEIKAESIEYLLIIREVIGIQKSLANPEEEKIITEILDVLQNSKTIIDDDHLDLAIIKIKEFRRYMVGRETKLNKNLWSLFSSFEKGKGNGLGHLGLFYRLLSLKSNFACYKILNLLELLNPNELEIDIRGPTKVSNDYSQLIIGEIKYKLDDEILINVVKPHLLKLEFLFKEISRMTKQKIKIRFDIFYHVNESDLDIHKEDVFKDFDISFIRL